MSCIAQNKSEILSAYEDVRSDKTETNWCLLDFDNENTVKVSQKGNGGLSEFKQHLKNDRAQFGFIRYVYSNDPLSQRAKFIFISWCGPDVKIMRKAKLTVQIADVKSVWKSFAVEIQTDDLQDLEEEQVKKLIKKAGGANYDRQASEY